MSTQNIQPITIKCPNCGNDILIGSLESLLSNNFFICGRCNLKLELNKAKSQQALEALKKVSDAQKELEKRSHFNG